MEVTSEILNNKLIAKQGLDEKTVRTLEGLHESMNQIVTMLDSLEWNEENKEQIFQLTKSIELLEFSMQKAWGFPQDKNYHTHWLRNNKCSCPRMDNRDIFYYGGGLIHSSICVIHGENGINPEFWQNLKGRDYGR